MSDKAIKVPVYTDPRSQMSSSSLSAPVGSAIRRYAFYAMGALLVVLTLAYIDGGEEPLHPIAQTVSLPSQTESQP